MSVLPTVTPMQAENNKKAVLDAPLFHRFTR